MPTALLAGAFGPGNPGDEALLQAFAAALPEWHLLVTTRDLADGLSPGGLMEFDGVAVRRPLGVARRAISADAVIVGGATVFKLLDAPGRRSCGLLASASGLVGATSALGRPVAMIGVGAGQIHGSLGMAYTRFLVRHSDLLILRDEESACRLSAAGAAGPFRVGADPTWAVLDPPEEAREGRTSRVLVVPSRDAEAAAGGRGPLLEMLSSSLRGVISTGYEVWLQTWLRGQPGGDDATIVSELAERLGDDVGLLPAPRSLREAVGQMRTFGAALCLRYHALIAAGAAGVPAVSIAYESKLTGLGRRLGQPVLAPPVAAQRLADELCTSVERAGASPSVVKAEIERAEEGLRLLRVLLAGGGEESDSLGALPLVPWPS